MSDTIPGVKGFRFAGISCGIKSDGKPDLGLAVAEQPVATAAVFTRNRVKAAPVVLAAERLERGRAQAIVVNSGNANACTGKQGMERARTMTEAVADALHLDDDMVLPSSTGIIGVPLPVERITTAMPDLVAKLSPDGLGEFAESIRTTDRWVKSARREFEIGRGVPAVVTGVAKGAGMIHPNMATTLAFVFTDAPMSTSYLQSTLRRAVDHTFNAITVDGETSTNDAVFAMSSGLAETEPLRGSDGDAKRYVAALTEVLEELGRSIVKDGEGAEHLVRLEVSGAPSEEAAREVARRVADSLLVKVAIHGKDPNWGRILSAAGTASVAFDDTKVEIHFDRVAVVKKGMALGRQAEADARSVMQQPEYTIRLKLGAGPGKAHYDMCDIGPEYVRVNSAYRT